MKTRRIPAGPWMAGLIVGMACGGCSTLLPASRQEVVSDWINLYEVQRNPLGPLRSWGDQMLQGVH